MGSVSEIQQRKKRNVLLRDIGFWHKKLLLGAVDLCLLILALFYFHRSAQVDLHFYEFVRFNNVSLLFGVGIFWMLTIIFNYYDLDNVNKTRKVLPLSFFIGLIFTVSYIIITGLSLQIIIGNRQLIIFVFSFTALLVIWRVVYASVIHTNVFAKNCIILTSVENDKILIHRIISALEGSEFEYGLRVIRSYQVSSDEKQISRLSRAIERMAAKNLIDMVIIMDKDQGTISTSLNTSLVKAMGNGVQIETYFQMYEAVKEAIPVQFAKDQLYSILPISKYNHNYIYLLWHKFIDISSSILGLTTMLVLTPLIVVTNLFFNKGPLFYRQIRVGKGGKEIEILKFRSMVVEAEKHGAKMSLKGDKRVTSFGKILRKFRIDELPQFLAVLKGDMSLIGPRPERKIFIDELTRSIPLYDSRHLINPGITGWAQVKYPYGENIEDSIKKLEYDLYYIKNRSVTLDIRIIFKTVNTILFYKGV